MKKRTILKPKINLIYNFLFCYFNYFHPYFSGFARQCIRRADISSTPGERGNYINNVDEVGKHILQKVWKQIDELTGLSHHDGENKLPFEEDD